MFVLTRFFDCMSEDNPAPDNTGKVNVEFLDNEWVVKNDGDSSILFRSTDKEAAQKFAAEMADAHEIELQTFKKTESSGSPVKAPEQVKVNVERREGKWVVRKDGEAKDLYSSEDKKAAIEFANGLDEGNGIDLHVDKD